MTLPINVVPNYTIFPVILFNVLVNSATENITDLFLILFLLPVINIQVSVNLMKVRLRNIYRKVMVFLKIFPRNATPALDEVFSFLSLFISVNFIYVYVGIILFPVCALSFSALPKFFKITNNENPVSKGSTSILYINK